MYQIDNSTATPSRPPSTPPGTPGYYTDGNPGGGQPATIVPAEWLNMLQDELINVLRAAGIAPNKAQFNQIALALQFGLAGLGVDSGSANLYLITLASAPPVLTDGINVLFRAHAANTGASTLNLNGLGAQPLLGQAQQPLQGNEIALGGFVRAVWSANLAAWVMMDNTGGAFQAGTASASRHAPTVAQMQAGYSRYAADTGSGNAYVVALTPVPAAPADGFQFTFLATHANTGAATLLINSPGATAAALMGDTHVALQGGEILANTHVRVVWNAVSAFWVILNNTGGSLQVANASQSRHAVPLSQVQSMVAGVPTAGRWMNTIMFLSSGTYSPSAGVTKIRVRAMAGGGGGGGAAATGAGQCSVATGGTSGMYCECWMANPGAQAVTIGGGGGAAPPGGSGGAGGTTAFGGLMTLLGGNGGYGGGANVPPILNASPVPPSGGVFPSGWIVANRGSGGGFGVATSPGAGQGGSGGGSPFGGAVPGGNQSAGRNGPDLGSGGSGAEQGASMGGAYGGAGSQGVVIIEEYS